jgi:formate hydrogenlyase subunit 4
MVVHSLTNLVDLVLIFALYNFVTMFVFRYCQTRGNRFLELLSSKKCFLLHIGSMFFVALLLVPTNAANEEELQEYKEHMDPLLRELVQDYAFYGFRVNSFEFCVVVRKL